MKNLILILSVLIFIGCKDVKDTPPKDFGTYSSVPTLVESVKHDTVVIQNFVNDSTIKELLIEYYKAGWMEGTNHIINLHNDNTLSDKTLKMVRNTDWRKIEYLIRSK